MARKRPLSDDGSPIVVGDSTGQRPGSPLKKFLSDQPHISVQHACFRAVFGGLAIQNTAHRTATVESPGGDTKALTEQWFLDLNGGSLRGGVTLFSMDSLTVFISHAGDYDLVAGGLTTALIIGTKNLSSAKLNGEKLKLGTQGLSIKWVLKPVPKP
jgi:hypothetical protein